MANYKNVRPVAATIGQRNPVVTTRNQVPDKGKFASGRINMGMITMIDPADIPDSALQLARNARCRFDRTSRRPGTELLTPTKPDSLSVLKTYYFKKNSGATYFLRFTAAGIFYRSGAMWQPVPPGLGATLTGTDQDRYQVTNVLDRCFFTNNGVDPIQEFDPTTNTFIPVGNAPQARYITGFFNRIVAAHLLNTPTTEPTTVAWCGDANPTVWDIATDETAGKSPIIESTSDQGDYITGIFGFTNVMALLREQSIWLTTKQPIPTAPFYFYTAFPGLGCNCPNSARITLNGITWVDQRSGSVWHYQPGSAPDRIGRYIERDLMKGLDDPSLVFSSYAPTDQEYTVCIPQSSFDYAIAWTYNFRTQSWVRDEYEAVVSIDDPDLAVAITTIDELGDLPIDSLAGDIDSLSPSSDITPVRVFGRNDGEIIQENQNVYVDPVVTGSANSTGKFQTELASKAFTLPTIDGYFQEVRLGYIPISPAALTLMYSKDGGATWITSKTITPTAAQIGKPQLFRRVKPVRARRFAWKLMADDGQFELIEFEVHVYEGGESVA